MKVRNQSQGKKGKGATKGNRLLLFLFITACFFTGVRYWYHHHTYGYKVLKVNPAAQVDEDAPLPRITDADAFPTTGQEDDRIKLSVDGQISGEVIDRFTKLRQAGIVAADFPTNPWEMMTGLKASTLKRDQGVTCVGNVRELGVHFYDCAARGCDTFIFKCQGGYDSGWKDYYDIETKGYLFTDIHLDANAAQGVRDVRIHVTDSAHILSVLKAERNWTAAGKAGHSPAWADLTPEELQTLNMALKILEERIRPDMSDEAKAEALAKYLCEKLEYHALKDKTSVFYRHKGKFVIYALKPIMQGKTGNAICEGYTKSYGFLLTLCGVPSMEVDGCVGKDGYHAWNLVKMGGGWYHVDTTWMDGRTVNMHFFKATDDFMAKSQEAGMRTWPNSGFTPYPASPKQ